MLLSALLPVALAEKSPHERAQAEGEAVHEASVYAQDGALLGTVAGVIYGEDAEVSEIRIRVASRLGLGEKIVSVPSELAVTLEGAVVLMLTAEDVDRMRPVEGAK
jgi:hypothetical protein